MSMDFKGVPGAKSREILRLKSRLSSSTSRSALAGPFSERQPGAGETCCLLSKPRGLREKLTGSREKQH